jgi:hypothetical protein
MSALATSTSVTSGAVLWLRTSSAEFDELDGDGCRDMKQVRKRKVAPAQPVATKIMALKTNFVELWGG